MQRHGMQKWGMVIATVILLLAVVRPHDHRYVPQATAPMPAVNIP
jgi:hypothetical protein